MLANICYEIKQVKRKAYWGAINWLWRHKSFSPASYAYNAIKRRDERLYARAWQAAAAKTDRKIVSASERPRIVDGSGRMIEKPSINNSGPFFQ